MSRYEARRDADTRAALDDYEKVKADLYALLVALEGMIRHGEAVYAQKRSTAAIHQTRAAFLVALSIARDTAAKAKGGAA